MGHTLEVFTPQGSTSLRTILYADLLEIFDFAEGGLSKQQTRDPLVAGALDVVGHIMSLRAAIFG